MQIDPIQEYDLGFFNQNEQLLLKSVNSVVLFLYFLALYS